MPGGENISAGRSGMAKSAGAPIPPAADARAVVPAAGAVALLSPRLAIGLGDCAKFCGESLITCLTQGKRRGSCEDGAPATDLLDCRYPSTRPCPACGRGA